MEYVTVKINKPQAAIIASAVPDENESFAGAVKRLAAEGLKYIMCFDEKYPISRKFLDVITDSAAIFQLFQEFEDAKDSDNGKIGVLGGLYRLAETLSWLEPTETTITALTRAQSIFFVGTGRVRMGGGWSRR